MRNEFHKICEYCRVPFIAKNKNAKYCSDGHRQMGYKIRNNIPMPDWSAKDVFKRIPSKKELLLTDKIRRLHELEQLIKAQVSKLDLKEVNELKLDLKEIDALLKELINYPIEKMSMFHTAYQNEYYHNIVTIFLRQLLDVKHYKYFNNDRKNFISKFKEIRPQMSKEEKKMKQTKIKEELINTLNRLYYDIDNNIQFIEKKINKQNLIEEASELNEEIQLLQKGFTIEQAQKKGSILSVKNMLEKNFEIYEFKEDFEKIFGNPVKSFLCMLHGSKSSGKTTFSIKFADYFQRNHGNVLFVSSEMGTSQPLQLILQKNNITTDFNITSDSRLSVIKKIIDSYSLIIIDSVNQARYSLSDIENLIQNREENKTSFLFLFQETKEGDYKGISEFEHLVDIKLKAESGKISIDGKNRCKSENWDEYYLVF